MAGGVSLADRFRGSMVGALVGDCLGANFECQYESLVPGPLLDTFFRDLEKNDQRQVCRYGYVRIEEFIDKKYQTGGRYRFVLAVSWANWSVVDFHKPRFSHSDLDPTLCTVDGCIL